MKKGFSPGTIAAAFAIVGSVISFVLDAVSGHYADKQMKAEIDETIDKKLNERFKSSKNDKDDEDEDEEEDND